MFSKTSACFVFLSLLLTGEQVLGRERWLERNNRAVYLYPRRFGQEQPAVLQKLRAACPGQVCGNLAGQAVTPLLAAQPECSQQDMADAIIDASRQFDNATQANMIAIAQEYRQAEKNTPPDFSTNPPTLRNSVFCQTAPQNPELNGLVQAQDPANDPNVFFDPATGKSVQKGAQANTFPFGSGNNTSINNGASGAGAAGNSGAVDVEDPTSTAIAVGAQGTSSACVTVVTVTVSATNAAAATITNAVTVSVGQPSQTNAPAPTGSTLPDGSNFGSCSIPEIEFGDGFDGRKETSFQPVDKTSYNHGSADNINIITLILAEFMCDTLVNSCGANQAASDLCATAETAAASATTGGTQADAFNAVFGITTDFAAVPIVNDQGQIVSGTGGANSTSSTGTAAVSSTVTATSASSATATSASSSSSSSSSSPSSSDGNANFGSCSTPEIVFGAGFDGRVETSFEPADLRSFNHGSADGIGIIAQFICGQLASACGANQAAQNLCAQATNAASSAPAGTGGQADAFNAVFGIQTNFANVQVVNDQNVPQGSTGSNAGPSSSPGGTSTTTAAKKSSSQTPSPAPAPSPNNLASDSSNLQKFSGALGGVAAPAVQNLGNGSFSVGGTSTTFNSQQSAVQRSCDTQNNQCADAANASGNQNGFTVAACNQQLSQCLNAN
ncbi:hypothetical protein NP233_g7089 [Leucocoprinus birnbaumii]|uniref:Uncharacterized protein n=1 Tax=Leucocoprinus birnbaumii TaxID=56174 RepID=A0AAD5YT42_9AGAR|nr:hypothetical protein NP233_g7089 [Leucocoprinus birnbaumii]